jgi:hypothetical protein
MSVFTEELYEFIGKRVCVKCDSPEISTHLRAIYGRFLREKSSSDAPSVTIEIADRLSEANEITMNDGFYHYRISPYNGTFKWVSQDIATKTQNYTGTMDLLHFVQTIVLRTVTLLMTDYPLFHAGVVSWKNRGIILPAHPDRGKTTLVVKLVMSGCGFLSDEIACFSPDLSSLKAFPRRLSIRDNSRRLLGLPEWEISADVIRNSEDEWMADIEYIVPGSHVDTCTPHSIFFLQGFGDTPRIEKVPSSRALVELLKFAFCPVEDPAGLLFRCAPMINTLKCYTLVSANIADTVKMIIDVVDRNGCET